MGLRKRFVGRVRRVAARFSGEYSANAPDAVEPYARPGTPNEDAEVVMARLNRPKTKRAEQKKDE
jgi:hypothetical protein